MSIKVNVHPSDDPAFIHLMNTVIQNLDYIHRPEEVFIVEIKNWFDHKWLNFSGIGRVSFNPGFNQHPGVALQEMYRKKITFPPFNPNRILHESWWAHEASQSRERIHRRKTRQRSAKNLQRRVHQFSDSALFMWYSSGTQHNDRASLMVYRVHEEEVDTWYASFKNEGVWQLDRTKGISKDYLDQFLVSL